MDATIRPTRASDATLLPGMLALAVDWRPGTEVRATPEVLADPMLARYVDGWPRLGDLGVVAEHAATGVVGVAWLRLYPATAPSYGFVDEATPELALAVIDGHRGTGVGTALLAALLDRAREAGVRQVSLSVDDANPAKQLYVRTGFVEVAPADASATMLLRL